LYRLTGGRVGGMIRKAPVVLLTTTGRKSGQPRTAPLLALQDGENTVIVASNGGSDRHPVWWLNLQEHPEADLQLGSEKKRVRAERANDEEKARLWPQIVEMYSGYEEYQKKTERAIPLVILRPAGQD
jgi:deazaflavin-dependent oxidoreductase (nitroreductase family)